MFSCTLIFKNLTNTKLIWSVKRKANRPSHSNNRSFHTESSFYLTNGQTSDPVIKPVLILYLTSIEVILSSAPQEEDTEGDVGLQLKVNFMDKAVQRNARLAGKWGQAENTLSFFPFAPGESFKVHSWYVCL